MLLKPIHHQILHQWHFNQTITSRPLKNKSIVTFSCIGLLQVNHSRQLNPTQLPSAGLGRESEARKLVGWGKNCLISESCGHEQSKISSHEQADAQLFPGKQGSSCLTGTWADKCHDCHRIISPSFSCWVRCRMVWTISGVSCPGCVLPACWLAG